MRLSDALGQAGRELLPIFAAISGLEEATACAVVLVGIFPGAEAEFPKRTVDDIGVGRIDFDVIAADAFVFAENLAPGFAAVGGEVDAALFVRAVGMAGNCGEHAIGIVRIDGERGNALTIAKRGEVRPGFAGVGGFVDAVADREIWTREAFAASDIDNVRIRGRDGDGADGLRGLIIEDWRPGAAVVVGFPDAAIHLTHVENVWLAGHAAGGARAAAARGTDHAP